MKDLEFERLDPAGEVAPPPAEFAPGAPEYAALPPEYGQGAGAEAPRPKKHRGLRKLILAAAVLPLSFLFTAKTGSPAPVDPAPQGEACIQIDRAVLDGDRVRYQYSLVFDDPAEAPWPVRVYSAVSDPAGRTARAENDPDEWTSSRAAFEYEIDAAGLEGDLTLTLTARYARDGTDFAYTLSCPVTPLAAPPEVTAALEVVRDTPEGSYGFFQAEFLPQKGDGFDLEMEAFELCWYLADGTLLGRGQVDEGVLPSMRENPEGGWSFRYEGALRTDRMSDGAAAYTAALTLLDKNTGSRYLAESAPVQRSAYPLGGGKIVVTVYNDTTTFEVPTAVDDGSYMTILLRETVDEADFTQLVLPEPIAPDGAVFNGYVLHYGNEFDYGHEQMRDAEPFAIALNGNDAASGPVLTRLDVEKIPPSADGNRYVNLHAAWWVETAPCLILDAGAYGHWELNPYPFIYSEGYAYLDAMPVPEREGYWFAGWYDDGGSRVRILSYLDHCDKIPGMEGEAGVDWSSFHPITLHAVFIEE